MITRSEETIALLEATRCAPPAGREEAARARELLALAERQPLHLPRLPRVRAGRSARRDRGIARATDASSSRSRPPVSASCAPTRTPPGPSTRCRQPGTRHDLMIITKDNHKSRVHRPAYLDYIGIRTFDERRPGGRRAPLPRPVLLLRLLRERHPGAGAAAEGGRGAASGPATASRAMAARRSWTCWTPSRATSCSRPAIDRAGRGRWRRWPTSRSAARSGCSSAATRTAATCPAWSTCPGTATPLPSASGWRRSCSASSAAHRSTTPPGSASRCWPGCTSSSGCRSARRWARSTYAPWSSELTLATRSWNDEFADLIADTDHSGPAGHPGRRAAGGLQGGLHPAAGGPGPHRADRAGRRPRHVDGPVRARPRRRRGRPAAQDLPPRRLDVAVQDPAAPDPARGRRDRRAAVRARRSATTSGRSSTTSGSRCPAAPRRSGAAGPPRPGSSSWTRSPPPTRGQSEPDGFNALVMGADLRLARRQPAARRRSLPAPGRGHLQPDLHRPRR